MVTGGPQWVQRPKSVLPGRVRLFCLPHAGGSSSAFNSWSQYLEGHVEPWPVLLPGRGVRMTDRPIEDHRKMVAALAEGLAPHLQTPFALFGHSMGALLAHELTKHLIAHGGPRPCLLAVSARQAPHLEWKMAETRTMSDTEFIQMLGELSTETTQFLSDPSLRKVLLPILRADFKLCESWRPVPIEALDIPILAFAGEHDPNVAVESIEAWGSHTRERFATVVLPGRHFLLQPFAKEICAAIENQLARAMRRDYSTTEFKH